MADAMKLVEIVAREVDPDAWSHVDACHKAMIACDDAQLATFRKVIEKRLDESGSIATAERVLAALEAASPPAREEAPGEGAGDSTAPPPHWADADQYDRHPKAADDWNWRNDPPLSEGGLDLAVRRLNFAGDMADPRAPDQMALVLRKDLINIKHELIRQTARAAHSAPATADKLKVAKEALEGALPHLETLHSIAALEAARSIVWREIKKSRQALATLNEEG